MDTPNITPHRPARKGRRMPHLRHPLVQACPLPSRPGAGLQREHETMINTMDAPASRAFRPEMADRVRTATPTPWPG
jgi:hypothetical protein